MVFNLNSVFREIKIWPYRVYGSSQHVIISSLRTHVSLLLRTVTFGFDISYLSLAHENIEYILKVVNLSSLFIKRKSFVFVLHVLID